MYKIFYTKIAIKHIKLLKAANLAQKAQNLIKLLEANPYQTPPPYERLIGNYEGLLSRRINIKHRLVYMVDEEEKTVKIISLWSHYEF